MKYIYLPDLVNKLKNDLPLSQMDLEMEAAIGKPKCYKYYEPREHLKLFANAFIVESAMKELYGLSWNDAESHLFLHDGPRNKNATDFHDEYGNQIECKYFKYKNKFKEWLDGQLWYQNHNADCILVYVIEENTVYVCFDNQCVKAKKQFEKPLDLFK